MSDKRKIVYKLLADLVPYERNARVHGESQVEAIVRSIERFGWTQPMLISAKNGIIAGHCRRLAALQLGLRQVPCIVLDHLTEDEARALVIADNKLGLLSSWDEGLLRVELGELKTAGFDLNFTGFGVLELRKLYADEKQTEETAAVPLVPEVPTSRLYDTWLLGDHRIVCCDSTDKQLIAALLGDRAPALMVTDPPYGVNLDLTWRDEFRPAPGRAKESEACAATEIKGDDRHEWSQAFELVPSLEVAYVWHAEKFTREILDGLLRIGFIHHQQIIWDKGVATLGRSHYWYQHEPCWYVRKKNAPWFGVPGKCSTVWAAHSPKQANFAAEEERVDHPNQKPLELMRKPIANHTQPGEWVYDPFLGSGTTLIAAQLLERKCVGVELDPKFVDVIIERWQNLTGLEARLDVDGRGYSQVKRARTVSAAVTTEK